MITITVTGKPAPGQDKIARTVYDALVGSRHVVRYYANGRPSEIPQADESIIVVIDETDAGVK